MNRIALLLIVFVFSCKTSENNNSQMISVDELAEQHLGKKFERKDQGDFSLCHTVSKTVGDRNKTVLVINQKTGEVVFGPESMNAIVDWYSDRKVVIKEISGTPPDRNSKGMNTYYFDVIDKKKELSDSQKP